MFLVLLLVLFAVGGFGFFWYQSVRCHQRQRRFEERFADIALRNPELERELDEVWTGR